MNVYEIKEDKLGKTIKLLGNNNEIRNKSLLYLKYKKINNYDYNFPKIGKYNNQILFKSSLININNMFYNCSSLISLNLSNFNTNNVTNMRGMFYSFNKRNCKLICNDAKILKEFS